MTWKTVKLGDVAEIVMGQSPDGIYYNTANEGLPLITGAGQFGEVFPKAKQFSRQGSKKSVVGDIIICIRATIGDLNWSDKVYYLGRGVASIRTRRELDSRFLWYWLKTQKTFLENAATGSTFKQIRRENVYKLEIPLPPLDEQKRIAAVLDKAELVRAQRRAAVSKLDELVQSVFLDMFGDPLNNPKGWDILSLNKLICFKTGKLDANAAVVGGEYPFFTCSKDNYQIDKYAFDCEALLLAGNNATADYSVKYYNGKFNAYQRTYVMTLLNPKHSYLFMRYILEMKLGEMKRFSKGANTKYLTLSILHNLTIPLPPLELQNKFADILKNIEAQKSRQKVFLTESDNLFQSIQQRAFAGELFGSKPL